MNYIARINDLQKELVIETKIDKENIVVDANLPIRFKEINAEETYTVADYFVKLDAVRLGDIYELAAQIYNLEESTNFFEELTLEQIKKSAKKYFTRRLPSRILR